MRKQNSTSRWQLPAMEHMKIDTDYAFSYNPESQPVSYASDRIQKWWIEMAKLFGSLKGCTINIKVEISKLGRLHFHGTIKISTLWKFYYYDVPHIMKEGSFEIDTIKKYDEWMAYVDKNKEEMCKMMEAFGLPYSLATERVKIHTKNKDLKRFFTEELITPINSETEDSSDENISESSEA